MPNLAGPTIIEIQNAYDTSATSNFTALGQEGVTRDGRRFRWVKAGGSSLVIGNLVQSPAVLTNFVDMAVQAAVAVGATTIPVTLGASSTTSGQFVGGTITISVTPGIGQTFTILNHDVATNGTTCNFYVQEGVLTALTTSSKATVALNQYNGVIQSPTTATGVPVGVATSAITNAQYGWVQVGGPCDTLIQSTPAVGVAVMPSGTTAGAVTTQTAGNPIVGVMMCAGVNGEAEPVMLTLP